MESLPVTLIVKAPNQQIEDQTIKCELSWSINKLKQHLSEVYPSKPPKHEQKLIYSGQLLSDSVILKDILRQYEGQETHTVHLVCTPKQNSPKKFPKPSVGNETTPQAASSNENSESRPSTSPDMNQRVPNVNNPMFNNFNPNTNMHWIRPENMDQFTVHMHMMQQAYLQYVTHYMNLANATNQLNSTNGITLPQTDQVPPREPQVPEVPPQQVPPAPQRDPENPQDWLAVFYTISRVMIFISIVYFYSSPVRFLFVLLFGIGLYLYQIGFFRNVNINNNNIVQGENTEEQVPSRLMVAWTFFTSFFASLIPEIPNVV